MKKLLGLLVLLAGLWWLHRGFSAQPLHSGADSAAAVKANPPAEPITWTNLINCAVKDGSLRKTRGRNDSPDAGAHSKQQFNAGNAYLEFTALETEKDRYIGLSAHSAGTAFDTIEFALHLTPIKYRSEVVAEVREKGVYRAETTYAANTLFRIAIEHGAVKYYKNDEAFYVSQQRPQFPLVAAVSLLNLGATVGPARFVMGQVPKNGVLAEKTAPPARLTALPKDSASALKAAASSSIAGISDDDKSYFPADYTTFLPPAIGVNYADAVFGTKITRLSDGLKQFNDAVHHEYATMSPFNSDSSLILLQSEQSGFLVVNRQGKLIVPPSALLLGGSSEPRWSGNDPNVFYYHEENRLKKFDIARRLKSTVRIFPQYQKITFGGGEGDISEDGDHLLIVGDDRYVGMYTFSRDAMGKVIDLAAIGAWHEVYLTANNNMLVRWSVEGVGKNKGTGLFDQELNFLRQVVPFGGHSDQGRDVNGEEVLLIGAYRDTAPPPGCENNGVEKIRLSDSKKTCLVPLNWETEIHVSSNSNGKNPWVLVSVTDTGKGTAEANQNLPADWQRRWGVRFNELILVNVDGSERRRIAHHRSRTLNSYWFQPRAALSREGHYAVFDSNFGIRPLPEYSDVFLVELNKAATRP